MWNYIKKRKVQFFLVLLLIFSAQAALSGEALIRQKLIDGVTTQDLDVVKKYVVILVCYTFFSVAFYTIAKVFQSVFADWLMNDIRSKAFAGIMSRSRKDFLSCNSADYISALTNDINTLRGYMNMLYTALLCIASMLFHAVLMFYYQPIIAISTVICAALITVAPLLLSKMVAKWQEERSHALAMLNTKLSEFFPVLR